MRSLLKILTPLFIICFGCTLTKPNTEDQSPFDHLKYLMALKNEVAKTTWPAFAEEDFFQPVVYYTMQGTFVLNPNEHIRNNFDHTESTPFDGVEVIRLSEKYTDTTSFQFHSSYSSSDSTALFYKENVLFFQSFDLTRKFLPEITDLQDWSIMVIHELFHGYQRSLPEHQEYFQNIEIPGGPDEFLATKHRDIGWYKESVYQENELLKAIWINGADPATNLNKFDSLRTVRINRIKKEFNEDIREAEDYEILTEGHARYMESLCKRYLSGHRPLDTMLTEKDQKFLTYPFKNYEVTKDKGLHDLYNDRYYYQLGYNISMILEQHLPEYQGALYFSENNFTPFLQKLKNMPHK